MFETRTTAILTALLVVASVGLVPGAVAADQHLAVETTQSADGAVQILVNGSEGPVAGATVNVSAVDANASYADNGSYETDGNGTLTLEPPARDVTVWVNASDGNDSVSRQVALLAPSLDVGIEQNDDASATVTVSYAITGEATEGANVSVTAIDGTYAGAGTDYVTGENGTAELPAPAESVEIRVDAEAGDLNGSATATLTNQSGLIEESNRSFGDWMSAFVQKLLDDMERGDGGIGHMVAGFATANNPGNAPDHAGPKDDAAPPEHAGAPGHSDDADDTESDDDDRPTASGADDDDEADRGPPEEAGPPEHAGADADEPEDDDQSGAADSGADGTGGGPPDHARGNGNGQG